MESGYGMGETAEAVGLGSRSTAKSMRYEGAARMARHGNVLNTMPVKREFEGAIFGGLFAEDLLNQWDEGEGEGENLLTMC